MGSLLALPAWQAGVEDFFAQQDGSKNDSFWLKKTRNAHHEI
jgi:hypothetical protein